MIETPQMKSIFHVLCLAIILLSSFLLRSSTVDTAEVSPNGEQTHPYPINRPDFNGVLNVVPKDKSYDINESNIVMDDYGLWKGPDIKSSKLHQYKIENAYSATEFVVIKGKLKLPKNGAGGEEPKIDPLFPFAFSVPVVDIDWEDFADHINEFGEDFKVAQLPQAGKRFLVKEPRELSDGLSLPVTQRKPDMTLNWPVGVNVKLISGQVTPLLLNGTSYLISTKNWSHGWPIIFEAYPDPNAPNFQGELVIKLTREYTDFDDHKQGKSFDEIKCRTFIIKLFAADLFNTLVPDDEKLTPGAFVHWNIDNDNAGNNNIPNPKHPGADYDKEYVIEKGEDDLKPFGWYVKPIPTSGKITLSTNGAKARIYKNQEKNKNTLGESTRLTDDLGKKTWDLAIHDERVDFERFVSTPIYRFYIEGVEQGVCILTLKYEATDGSAPVEDKVKYTFIAANCGYQPITQPRNIRKYMKDSYEKIIHCEWSVTAPESSTYNCIAWSVGWTDRWVEPLILDRLGNSIKERRNMGGLLLVGIDGYDPDPSGPSCSFNPNSYALPFERQRKILDNFYYETCGLIPTTGPEDAVVMYYEKYHAARRKNCACGNGKWLMFESKNGPSFRIEHVFDQLDGKSYGNRIRYYK